MKAYPHERQAPISTEPHFRRVWQFYREHSLRCAIGGLIEDGKITKEEYAAANRFCDLAGTPSLGIYLMGRYQGAGEHFADDEGFQAVNKIFNTFGFDKVQLDHNTSEPLED